MWLNKPRTHGYAPVGERCVGEQDLLPKLPPHCVIVMDNATFHKRTDIQKIIQDAGHTLDYLPPYSPDLNPIEYKWAQSKAIRRQKNCSIAKAQ